QHHLKRTIAEVLRRGFDSTVANWPVIALRIGESLVFAAIIIASVLAAIVPALVAAGLSKDDIVNSGDPAGAVITWLIGHLILFVWMFALAFLVLGVLIAIHAFVEGGSAQIYVDAERGSKSRNDLHAFSIDRWISGGASSWWRIFWLYNFAWSVGLIFVLVPLVITIAAMLVVTDTPIRIGIGCVGVAVAVLVMIPVGIVTSIWCTKAITICVARAVSARESLRIGWREVRADLGRHLAIAVILFVISMAINSVFSAFTIPMNISSQHMPSLMLMFAPVRIVAGVVQGMVGAAVGSCLLACFVSMTEER
ncbi:MAG: hypothetical protein ACRD3J_11870, partial [Thermoanaerobaculia bacterium]